MHDVLAEVVVRTVVLLVDVQPESEELLAVLEERTLAHGSLETGHIWVVRAQAANGRVLRGSAGAALMLRGA